MAQSSTEEKTEKATPKRLREARKKGQVSKSQELAGGISLLAALLTVISLVPHCARRVADLQLAVERLMESPTQHGLQALVLESLRLAAVLSLPVLGVAALVGTTALWIQVGPVFAFDALTPKFERLDPVAGMKRLFSRKTLVNLLVMSLKTLLIGCAVLLIARSVLPDAIRVIHGDATSAVAVARVAIMRLLLWSGGAFVLIGAVDLAYQRWQFDRDMRMGRSEVKRELKEDEGDGHIKSERKRLNAEPAVDEMLKYMKFATLVLADAEGRVVAIVHRATLGPRPLFLLRSTGAVATQVLRMAAERRLRVVRVDELMPRMFPIAHSGVPVPEEMMPDLLGALAALRRR